MLSRGNTSGVHASTVASWFPATLRQSAIAASTASRISTTLTNASIAASEQITGGEMSEREKTRIKVAAILVAFVLGCIAAGLIDG